MDNLEKVQMFFDGSVEDVTRVKNNPMTKDYTEWLNKMIDMYINMNFGVQMFAQTQLGVDYDAVAPMFDEVKKELEKMKEVV